MEKLTDSEKSACFYVLMKIMMDMGVETEGAGVLTYQAD